MAVANPVELSGYITAMAVSARAAQAIISAGADPMIVKEFGFKANISADFEAKSETDISLSIWRITLKEKITIDYKSHWGLEINCTLVPVVTL